MDFFLCCLGGFLKRLGEREIQDKTIESLQINTEFVKQDLISKQVIKFSFQIKKTVLENVTNLKSNTKTSGKMTTIIVI